MTRRTTFGLLLFIPALISVVPGCSGRTPPVVAPEIVAEIPHDPAAFVQGLFYDRGVLYESLGLYGRSALRTLDARSGILKKNVPLDSGYFGEGCAKMGETVVQLTWREKTAFAWSCTDLSLVRSFVYGGEGWGLTSDGKVFYMSNGSDTIAVRGRNFAVIRKIPVRSGKIPQKRLNELEYADGKIYANVWYSDSVLEIDPESGRVERIVDCSALKNKEGVLSPECVLNGIAYDAAAGLFYLTGKNWKKIFLVKISAVIR